MFLGHVPLQITACRKECLRNMLNASERRVNRNSLTWWYVLKTSWRYSCKTSWRCLEDVFKTSWRGLEDVLKTFWRGLADVLKMPWRRLQNVLKTSSRCLEDVFARRLEDVWPRRIYWSWPSRLEDVCWRHKAKANIFVLIKTSWRRFLKTKTKSSWRLHQDKCFLGFSKQLIG